MYTCHVFISLRCEIVVKMVQNLVRTSRVIKIDIANGQNESLHKILSYMKYMMYISQRLISFSLVWITMIKSAIEIDNTTKHH